jgi:cell division protein FtsB
MKIRYLTIILTISIFILVIGVFRAFFQYQDRSRILKNAQEKYDEANSKNEALKRELAQTEQYEYIEKEAREKLGLSREGEVVVILPENTKDVIPTPTPTPVLSNFQKWLKLFM